MSNFYMDAAGHPILPNQTLRFCIEDEMEPKGYFNYDVQVSNCGTGFYSHNEKRIIPFSEYPEYKEGRIADAKILTP